MTSTETIKDFYGKTIGYIETDSVTGNKTARDFFRHILGYYKKRENKTTDFYGKQLTMGDTTAALIYNAAANKKEKK